jgi:hypothetical protein
MEKICRSLLRWITRNDRKTQRNFCKEIKEFAANAKCVLCSIQRQAQAAGKMPAILKTVLTEAVKFVNLIKSTATNSRSFSILFNEKGSEHDKLLYTDVRWLSWGKV